MPINKIKNKSKLDKFYTKTHIAAICFDILVKYINKSCDTIIEPSAGSGNMLSVIPSDYKVISYDIEPENSNIIKKDFLTVDSLPENSVIFGNPPFGNRNNLSKKFIKHCILLNAKVIGFILPATYNKETLQQIFSDNWMLVEKHQIEKYAFILENVDYHVPALFYVWVDKNKMCIIDKPDLRESKQPKPKKSPDFVFCSSSNENKTHFIFGAAPNKIIKQDEVNSKNRGYYVISKNDNFTNNMTKINWKQYANSNVSGGVAWFTKNEILKIYNNEVDKNE